MTALQALVLGAAQALTEFLPVSSSAHLVLLPWLLGWPEPGLLFDTTVHLGTLAGVIAYFWRDLLALVAGWLRSLRERTLRGNPSGTLAWLLIVATIPGAVLGALFEREFEALFGRPRAVAGFLLVTGALLLVSERLRGRRQPGAPLTLVDAIVIGLAQAVAIAPGISRSGATIAAGLLRGLPRPEAARFSFRMAIPIIAGAGGYQLLKAARLGVGAWAGEPLLLGFLVSAGLGYVTIRTFLWYLVRRGLVPFTLYCWVVGLGVLLLP
ncbi:MAG: undecaprenyl-diphosphate phosphatase [Deltaproteobacteria bacterium]|nr:undecaprenyl-diphosphate phosphatase [Deltaproteobacteria bacterium]